MTLSRIHLCGLAARYGADCYARNAPLLFDPGTDFYYSNFGLEQFALAMRGQRVGPYLYDRVLGKIGIARGVRDNEYRDVPYRRLTGLNFSK
jgi:hypothetical protein